MTIPEPDATAAGHPSEAVTLGMAERLGLSRNQLRARAWTHLSRNVYLRANDADDLAARCAAFGLVLPADARFSHLTAARLLGAPLAAGETIHVTVPAGANVPRRRPGLTPHQRVLAGPPATVGGLPVTPAEQTFLDLATLVTRPELLVLGDHLVNRWTTQPRLVAYLQSRPGLRGVVRAREVAALVRPGVDSPQESRLRLHIVDSGLPEPAVNHPAFDDAGGWLGSPDLGYEEYRVAVQYEGDVHRTTPRRWRQDIARDEGFRDAGWLVLRAVSDDVTRPSPFLQRLTRALISRGWRPPR